jgi:hypothetical protein
MAREPSYPDDAPVEPPAGAARPDEKKPAGRTKHLVTGAAIGIGSAALVAALLYANRSRGKSGKA